MLTRLLSVAALSAGLGCGDDPIIVDDDGISSGGVKLETVEPPRGTIVGGQNVLLEGVGLGGNNVVVAFGEMAAEEVVVLSSEAVLVVSPPGLAPGPVDVVVANAQGFAQRNGGFTYNDPPSVTAVSPDSGARQGGETVTIIGSGYQENDAGENQVFFDGEPASEVSVLSDTELTAVTPPGLPFVRAEVEVVNVNGAGRLPDGYLYQANGLFATNPDPTRCRGSNNHSTSAASLVFIDLDDNTTVDLGLTDPDGFTQIAADTEGGLVGLQACSNDLFQIDHSSGEISLLADVTVPEGSRRHLGGMVRDGNDYIVRGAPDTSQFARLSQSTGQINQIGEPGNNPNATVGRGGLAVDGGQVFWAGQVTVAQNTVNGFAEIDLTTGAQVGDGTAFEINFTINSATIHRGELFIGRRIILGDGGGTERAIELIRVDRASGAVEFLLATPTYVTTIVSGDL